MKQALVVLAFVFLAPTAMAQRYVEHRVTIAGDDKHHQLETWLQGDFEEVKGLGWFAWALVSKDWSQMYIGPTYSPTGWCQFGAAVGIETSDDPLRYGLYGWMGKGKFSAIGFWETGGSGQWHQLVGGYQANQWLKFSAMRETFLGNGPRVDFTVKCLSFHTAVLREKGTNSLLLGTAFNF